MIGGLPFIFFCSRGRQNYRIREAGKLDLFTIDYSPFLSQNKIKYKQ